MTTYVVTRETAETVAILAQAAEHLTTGLANLHAAGIGPPSKIALQRPLVMMGEIIEALLQEMEQEESEESDAGA